MKKKVFILLSILILIPLISISIYAAFTFNVNVVSNTTNFDTNENQTITDSNQTAKVDYQKGNKETHIINITNGSNKLLNYTISLATIEEKGSGLIPATLVYQDNAFIGTLNNVVGDLESFIIPAGKSKSISIGFELHNAVEKEIYDYLSFDISISCSVNTLNTNDYSVITNANQLKEAIKAVNLGMNKELVILNDITLTENLIISKKCSINLFGSNINFAGNTITINENASVILKTTNGNKTYSSTSGGFVVDSETAFLNVDNSVVEFNYVTVNEFDFNQLLAIISNEKYSLTSNTLETVDIFKGNKVYLNKLTVTPGSDIVYSAGIVSMPNKKLKTYVDKVSIVYKNITKDIEIVVYGSLGDEAYYDSILDSELAYLNYYAYDYIDGAYSNGNDLASDLFLPTSIKKYNASLIWSSSDLSIMSNSGKTYEGSQGYVELTASIRINEYRYEKTYYINVIKQTNEQKLQYLISKMKIVLTNLIDTQKEYLPVVNILSENDYRKKYGIKDLGLVELSYSLIPEFYYLAPIPTTNPYVALNQITFESFCQINIHAKFDGVEEIISDKVNIEIDLQNNPELIARVVSYIQSEANNVNVLNNMLTTRLEGIEKESGNFTLPNEYNGFNISYELVSGEATYSISNNQNNLFIVNPDQFKLIDYYAKIKIIITVADKVVDDTHFAEVKMPGAIHNDDNGFSNESIFYSVKYQVLQQIFATNSGTPSITLPTDFEGIKSLGNYILMHDILLCDTLIFEIEDSQVKIDVQEFELIDDLINWATSTTNTPITDISNIESSLSFIISDSKATISDAEELAILSICKKFPYFEATWYKILYQDNGITKDNTITTQEENGLITILTDSVYSALISWATGNEVKTVNNVVGTQTDTIFDYIGAFESDALSTISSAEEEAIIRYCEAKEYAGYYDVWLDKIKYQDNVLDDTILIGNQNVSFTDLLFSDLVFFNQLKNWVKSTSSLVILSEVFNSQTLLYYFGTDQYNSSSNAYHDGWFDDYDVTSETEKIIIKAFASHMGYTGIDTIIDNNRNYSSNLAGGKYLSESAWNSIENIITNQKNSLTSNFASDMTKIISWAKATSGTRRAGDLNSTLTKELKDTINKYNDLKSEISYPEYSVIREYINLYYRTTAYENGATSIGIDTLNLYLNMSFSDQTLSDDDKDDLLNTLGVDLDNLKAIIAWFKTKGVYTAGSIITFNGIEYLVASDENGAYISLEIGGINYNYYYDALSTISSRELEQLKSFINLYSDIYSEVVIEEIKAYIDSIVVIPNTELTITKEAFSEYKNDITPLATKDSILNNYENYYIFTNTTLDTNTSFEGLKYFSNLKTIYFNGIPTKDYFINSIQADYVLKLITSNINSINKIVMRYAGLSSIESLSQVENLIYLDISGNSKVDSISSLLNSYGKIDFLNISGVFDDLEFSYQYTTFDHLYIGSQNSNKKYVYNLAGNERFYEPSTKLQNYLLALQYAFLLKEIGVMEGNLLSLPTKIAVDSSTEGVIYVDINWAIHEGQINLVTLSNGAYLSRVNNTASTCIITATVNVGTGEDIGTYTRYFVVNLTDISGGAA